MKQVIKRYRWVLTISTLLIWILVTPSWFQKGGVDLLFYVTIVVFVNLISFLIISLIDKSSITERLMVSTFFALLSLFITGIIMDYIIDYLYGDRTWILWEIKPRLLINSIYYGLNAIIQIVFAYVYSKFKVLIKKKKIN